MSTNCANCKQESQVGLRLTWDALSNWDARNSDTHWTGYFCSGRCLAEWAEKKYAS